MRRISALYEIGPFSSMFTRALLLACGVAVFGCDEPHESHRDSVHEAPLEIGFRSSVGDFCDDYDNFEVTIGFAEGAPWDPQSDDLWIGATSDGHVFLDRNVDADEPDDAHRWKIVCNLFDSEFLLMNVEHGSYLAPPTAADDPVAAEKSTSPPERFWWDLERVGDSAEYRILATFRECSNVLGVRGEEDGEQLLVNSGHGLTTVFTIYSAY